MSFFLKWYLAKLQSHPFLVNTGTAVAMMTTGDAVAQKIESGRCPIRLVAHATSTAKSDSQRFATTSISSCYTADPVSFYCEEHNIIDVQWKIETHGERLDLARLGTMAAWATLFYSPFYVTLYRVFDRYLPRQGALSVVSRVGLSFASSVPVNAAFYMYGTLVQHAIDSWNVRQRESKSMTFQWSEALESARSKIQTQLPNTIAAASMVWIPINLLNFSFVPVHLRPLTLMVCSAGWNCYLSLNQHQN